jgi:membrane protein DedA with SNARE-associated domain
LADIVEMPFAQFMLYNILGAVLWASAIVSAAYVAGQWVDLEQLIRWVSQFSFVVLGAIAAWFLVPMGVKAIRKTWFKPVSESEIP